MRRTERPCDAVRRCLTRADGRPTLGVRQAFPVWQPLVRGNFSVDITVNGTSREVRAGVTVTQLLEELEMQPRFVAVERNLELVPRREHCDCVLESGDHLEIVTLVGGG